MSKPSSSPTESFTDPSSAEFQNLRNLRYELVLIRLKEYLTPGGKGLGLATVNQNSEDAIINAKEEIWSRYHQLYPCNHRIEFLVGRDTEKIIKRLEQKLYPDKEFEEKNADRLRRGRSPLRKDWAQFDKERDEVVKEILDEETAEWKPLLASKK